MSKKDWPYHPDSFFATEASDFTETFFLCFLCFLLFKKQNHEYGKQKLRLGMIEKS